jgi:hypothetical protein
MSKNSYPEELLALLQTCLTDGAISAKEREVLLKKAEKLNVDRDEFDLYIDAQQQKVDQTAQAASNRLRGATCPYCGGSVPQMAEKCPHCGEAITVEASKELKEIIEALESSLVDLKTNVTENAIANVERYMRKAQLYYSNNPKVKKLVAEVEEEMVETQIKAKEAKRNALIKKILKSKVFWWFAIVIIAVIVVYVNTDNKNYLPGYIFGTIFFVGLVSGGILNAMHESDSEKEEAMREERQRKEEIEHEERMAQLNNRRR